MSKPRRYKTAEEWAARYLNKEMPCYTTGRMGRARFFEVRGHHVVFLCDHPGSMTFTIRKQLPKYLWPKPE